jgi:hypothetical protein
MNDVVDAAVLTRQGPLLFTMWGYRAVRCDRAANDFLLNGLSWNINFISWRNNNQGLLRIDRPSTRSSSSS